MKGKTVDWIIRWYFVLVGVVVVAVLTIAAIAIPTQINWAEDCRKAGGTPYRSLCLAPGVVLEDVR